MLSKARKGTRYSSRTYSIATANVRSDLERSFRGASYEDWDIVAYYCPANEFLLGEKRKVVLKIYKQQRLDGGIRGLYNDFQIVKWKRVFVIEKAGNGKENDF